MINDASLWITPLTLISGAGLLILSSANRFARLHQEMHIVEQFDFGNRVWLAQRLIQRARNFRAAISFQYSSVALFALSGLAGSLGQIFTLPDAWARLFIGTGLTLTFLGILSIVASAFILIGDSKLSLSIIEHHAQRVEDLAAGKLKPPDGK